MITNHTFLNEITHTHKHTSEDWRDNSGEQTSSIDGQVEDREEGASLFLLEQKYDKSVFL